MPLNAYRTILSYSGEA